MKNSIGLIDNIRSKGYGAYKFKKEWCQDSSFANWLKQVSDPQSAYCTFCRVFITAKASVLKKHAKSANHLEIAEILKEGSEGKLTRRQKILRAEIKLAALVVSRHVPFLLCDYLTPLLKQLFAEESETAKNLTLCRTKVSNIIKNILAPAQTERLTTILKNTKYSIIPDESTDRSTASLLGIEVRYADEKKEQIVDSFWDLISIYKDENATADSSTIFNLIVQSFESKQVPLQNAISFCSDTCNQMFGNNAGVATQAREKYPQLLTVKCNCHIGNLCVKRAISEDPLNSELFIRGVFNYIKSSGKRVGYWIACQKKLGLTPITVKQVVLTRWLSFLECIDVIERRLPALEFFLQHEDSPDAQELYQQMQEPLLKFFISFYQFVLEKFCIINKIFQSEKAIVPKHDHKMVVLIAEVLKIFMDDDYVEENSNDITAIDIKNSNRYKPLEEMGLSQRLWDLLNECQSNESMNADERKSCLTNCRLILVESCSMLQEKFEYDQKWLPLLRFFNPENALNKDFHKLERSLDKVFEAFPFLQDLTEAQKTEINLQWSMLCDFEHADEERPDTFWIKLKKRSFEGKQRFELLAQVAIDILTIAPSNASIERRWSQMNLLKPKGRCRKASETIRCELQAYSYVRGNIKIISDILIEFGLFLNKKK